MKTFSLSVAALMALFVSFTAFAGPQFVDKKNRAINGYDTVAYFTESKPVKGDESISTEWNGSTWLFSSQENKTLFVASPEKYAPAYDGHCAFAAAQGDKVKIDPTAWSIVEGVLYLNYNAKVRTRWEQDTPSFITDGDANWPELAKKPAAKPGWF